MIVEQRTYTLHPGKVPEMVRLYGLARDPAWQAYLGKVMPLLVAQENRLLRPTAFSPIR